MEEKFVTVKNTKVVHISVAILSVSLNTNLSLGHVMLNFLL